MPVISCPSCQGKLRFPDDSPARRVKCPNCGHVFLGNTGPFGTEAKRRDEPEDEKDRRRRTDRRDDDRRGRRRDADDDDYDRRPRTDRRAIEGQFDRASLACLLCFIGGWLQVGALGLLVFVTILAWADLREGLNVFRVVAGLIGLGNLLTSMVGYGFLVSGPRDRGALGLSIATASVAGFHLILVLVIGTTWYQNMRDEQYAGVAWSVFVTEVPTLPRVLFDLIGRPDVMVSGRVILPIFSSLAEVAKVVLFLLTLRAVMGCARDSRRARLVLQALLANAIGFGVLVVLGLLFGVLALAVGKERGGWVAVNSVFVLATSMIQAGLVVWATMVTKGAKEGIDYRPD
jgi:hypothetical protein